MVAWLSSIKEKNLNNCGKFVLTGDMSQLSITKVDLSNMNTLEGTLGSRSVVRDAPGQGRAQRTFLGTFSISSHPSSAYLIPPGDIEVFKDMPLTDMNLKVCKKLTGVFGLGWGMVGGDKIGNRLRPQGRAQRTFKETLPSLIVELS